MDTNFRTIELNPAEALRLGNLKLHVRYYTEIEDCTLTVPGYETSIGGCNIIGVEERLYEFYNFRNVYEFAGHFISCADMKVRQIELNEIFNYWGITKAMLHSPQKDIIRSLKARKDPFGNDPDVR